MRFAPLPPSRFRSARPALGMGLGLGLGLAVIGAVLVAGAGRSARNSALAAEPAAGGYVLDGTIFGVELDLQPDIWTTIGGVAMAPDGAIFVSDSTDGRISRLEPGGSKDLVVRVDGGLVAPGHLAYDAERERLYAADTGLAALVAIDAPTGAVLWQAPGIAGPAGVAVAPDGRVLVAASDTGRVHVFGPEGDPRGDWSAAPVDELGLGDLVRGIDVDADGMVYVVDGRLERITVFDMGGSKRQTIKPPLMAADVAVEYDPALSGRLRVWVALERGMALYDARTREWQQTFTIGQPVAIATRIGKGTALGVAGGGPGPGPGGPGLPGGGPRFAPARVDFWAYPHFDGLPHETWGGVASRIGSLDGPFALSVGDDETMLVLDAQPRVQRFSTAGGVVEAHTVSGAIDAAAGADGVVYTLTRDGLSARGRDGAALWSRPLPEGGLALALNRPADALFVLTYGGSLHVYRPADGRELPGWRLPDPPGLEAGQSPLWRDLAADATGALYAVCGRSDTVTRIDGDGSTTSFPVGGAPQRLAAAGDGVVLVLGRDGWVRRYDAAGAPGAALDAVRFDAFTDSAPSDLAAAPDGRLFVADRRANVISRYTWDPDEVPASAPDPDDGAACRHYPDKRAEPGEIWLGETVDVRLSVRGGCGSLQTDEPIDVILVVDESGSMGGEKIATARAAARNFVAELDLEQARVGVVGFDTTSRLRVGLSDNATEIFTAIDMLRAMGGTRIDLGLGDARREMERNGRAGVARPVFVLLSDGYNNAGHEPVLREADAAKAAGIEIFTIGLNADEALMIAVATSPEHYFTSASAHLLYAIFDAIVDRISTATLFRELVVTDEIPDNMEYVPDSAVPTAVYDPLAHSLTWTLADVPFRGFVLAYTLEPLEVGLWPTNVVAWGEGRDGFDLPTRVDFPVPEVLVRWHTATPSPTPSPTPTPTPTPTPGPIYLPVLLRERCTPERIRADIVLVLDASSSMTGPPLSDAKAAAARFVEIVLAEAPTRAPAGATSRIAIVGFNSTAWLAHGLSGDGGAVRDAIHGLEVTPGTRIDLGLAEALAELRGPRRTPGHTPAIVLLTDGLQNGSPEPVYALAGQARAEGAALFMIGLGDDVDAGFLAIAAGDPRRMFLAPGSEDLRAIYEAVAFDIPCPADAFWGRR